MKRTTIKRGKRLSPLSKKMREVVAPALRRVRAHVMARTLTAPVGRCEYVDTMHHHGPLDPHHIVKKSHGGAYFDPNNVIRLCRAHHDDTDRPFPKIRLVILPIGGERFLCTPTWAPDKWAARARQ